VGGLVPIRERSSCVSGLLRQRGGGPPGGRPWHCNCGARAIDWCLVIERAVCLRESVRIFHVGETLCQVAVIYTVRVDVISCDRPVVVDDGWLGALTAASTRARKMVRSDLAVSSAHEAVIHTARVLILSRDHPRIVYGPRYGALTAALTCAPRIELGNFAVRCAHEAMICGVRVLPPSGGRTGSGLLSF